MLNDFGKIYMNGLTVEECVSISINDIKVHGKDAVCLDIENQLIELVHTNCFYGGVRYWFLCPACGRRAGKLYNHYSQKEFQCRICLNLTYELSKYHRSTFEDFYRTVHIYKRSR